MGKTGSAPRRVMTAGLCAALGLTLMASPAVAVEAVEKVETPVCRLWVSDEGDGWAKTDDAARLEDVHYRVEGTLPSNWSEFKNVYYYRFHVAYDEAIEPDLASVRVYLEGPAGERLDVTDDFAVAPTGSFEAVCDDLKAVEREQAVELSPDEWLVTLEYTATGNHTAAGIRDSLPTVAYIDYTSKPFTNAIGRSYEDAVDVVTWRLALTKLDATDGSALAGATFTLRDGDGLYVSPDGTLSEEPQELTVADDGTLEVVGVDTGTYELTETKAPEGYELIGDVAVIEFTGEPYEGEMVLGSEQDGWSLQVQCDHDSVNADAINDGLAVSIKDERTVSMVQTGGTTQTTTQTRTRLPQTGDPLLLGTAVLCIAGMTATVSAVLVRRKKQGDDEE